MEVVGVEIDVTELVDAFRVVKEIESRLPLRILLDAAATMDDWRGTRDVDTEGEARTEDCLAVFAGVSSPCSMTPNSLAVPVGEGFAEEELKSATLTLALARRILNADPEPLRGGDAAAEVRLEIRGIFVGVSFGYPETEFIDAGGGGSLNSLNSFDGCELFAPTEGDPAIVGN